MEIVSRLESETERRYPLSETPMVHAAARLLITAAEAMVSVGKHLESGDISRAIHANTVGEENVRRAIHFLVVGGARASDRPVPLPRPELVSTPATRSLYDSLQAATAAAEVVDDERGNVLPADFPLKPGEPRGTGWAEILSELTARLQREMDGFSISPPQS